MSPGLCVVLQILQFWLVYTCYAISGCVATWSLTTSESATRCLVIDKGSPAETLPPSWVPSERLLNFSMGYSSVPGENSWDSSAWLLKVSLWNSKIRQRDWHWTLHFLQVYYIALYGVYTSTVNIIINHYGHTRSIIIGISTFSLSFLTYNNKMAKSLQKIKFCKEGKLRLCCRANLEILLICSIA